MALLLTFSLATMGCNSFCGLSVGCRFTGSRERVRATRPADDDHRGSSSQGQAQGQYLPGSRVVGRRQVSGGKEIRFWAVISLLTKCRPSNRACQMPCILLTCTSLPFPRHAGHRVHDRRSNIRGSLQGCGTQRFSSLWQCRLGGIFCAQQHLLPRGVELELWSSEPGEGPWHV